LKSKIYVSIISTGNYPSQSAFEAYALGNILLLSDRGNTREKFTHPAFHFVDLDLASVKAGLLAFAGLSEGEKLIQLAQVFTTIIGKIITIKGCWNG
jgi:hypothetical protein